MREATKRIWISDDGQEFEDEELCKVHEAKQLAVTWLEGSGIFWRDTSAKEVVEELLENFDIIERKS